MLTGDWLLLNWLMTVLASGNPHIFSNQLFWKEMLRHWCHWWISSKSGADSRVLEDLLIVVFSVISPGIYEPNLQLTIKNHLPPPSWGDASSTWPIIASVPKAIGLNPVQNCMTLLLYLHARRVCVRPLKWCPFQTSKSPPAKSSKDCGWKNTEYLLGQKTQTYSFHHDYWEQ